MPQLTPSVLGGDNDNKSLNKHYDSFDNMTILTILNALFLFFLIVLTSFTPFSFIFTIFMHWQSRAKLNRNLNRSDLGPQTLVTVHMLTMRPRGAAWSWTGPLSAYIQIL